MKKNLASLIASGGGDGPDAQTAALADALNMDWTESAVKIVVLITDSPPHGIGECGDGFLKSPDQNDPLDIVRQMAERGITLYVIACEPALSQFMHAVDFYRAICQITTGRMVPLLNAAKLGDYIVGSALETMETEKLIGEFQHVILEDVYGQGKPIEEVVNDIQQQMSAGNVQINAINVEDAYVPSDTADFNTAVWVEAESIAVARGQTKTHERPRLRPQFSKASSTGRSFLASFYEPVRSGGAFESPDAGPFGAPSPSPSTGRGAFASRVGLFGTSGRGGFSAFTGGSADGSEPLSGRGLFGSPSSSTSGGGLATSMQQSLHVPAPMTSLSSSAGSSGWTQQAVDETHTRRVVMQSLMRNAKVGPGGVLTPTGSYPSKAPSASDPESVRVLDS